MITAVLAWLALAALVIGGLWLASKVNNQHDGTTPHESHRDRWGRPLAWRQTTQEAEELELLERFWRMPTTNEPREMT